MDTTLIIFNHVDYAHWVIFGLFMLAGLNVPISEDLLIIVGAILAGTVIPENVWKIFAAIFLGAYLSDWIPFWVGRKFGPNLWKIRWFSRMIKPDKLEQIKSYYQKYGVLTLLVGRFVPFGLRNPLFLTAGLGGMRFRKFLLADGIACFLSNSTLFSVAYFFGKNPYLFDARFKYFHMGIFATILIAIIAFFCYKRNRVSSVE